MPLAPLTPRRLGINTAISNGGSSQASPSPTPVESQRPTLSVDVAAIARDKRLPQLPSPHQRMALGAYDNKLVSSTLSQPPPLPPHSPSSISASGSNVSSFSHASASPRTVLSPRIPMLASVPRPAIPSSSSASVLILPDGTKLTTNSDRPPDREAMSGMMAYSSPNSPWSLITVHVLPLFAGSPLKTPIEDLNQLCNSHIMNASQRTPANRLLAVLTSDLRDFIASGMLTLKAKFESVEDGKLVSRAAEVWNFFWGQILPYVEAVFLPFSQVRAPSIQPPTIVASPPIPVRHILLSGFLVHILLPLLPRLIPLVAAASPPTEAHGPVSPDLPRLLQMSLVLSTQARYSSFVPGDHQRDEETREAVEELARAVRWAMVVISTPIVTPAEELGQAAALNPERPVRPGLQRGPSVSQAGRLRRRGTLQRSISQLDPEMVNPAQGAWPRPRIDEDDEEDRQSMAPTTLRSESVATLTDQRTPVYRRRKDSSGESDLTNVTTASNR